jgi:hypothetical protein
VSGCFYIDESCKCVVFLFRNMGMAIAGSHSDGLLSLGCSLDSVAELSQVRTGATCLVFSICGCLRGRDTVVRVHAEGEELWEGRSDVDVRVWG